MKKFLPIFNRILLPLALLLMAVQMRAESRSLKFSDVVLTPGGTAEMTVSYVTDYTDLTALQLNFILPEGITLADARVSSSLMQACPDLYFSYSPTRDDGTSVIMCYYLNGTLPTGSQETFVLTLKADANIAQRTYGIATTHIEFVHHNVDVPDIADSQSFFITVSKPAFSTLRGDVNNDRAISLTDVSMMASRIMKVDDGDFLAYNADVNGDGDITLADLMMLVNIILGNPDGLSFRWFLIALQSNGNAQPIPLDNVGSLAPAGDYDFTILDKGGNIILDNVTRAEFKYEYELETAGYSVPAAIPAAYNIATYATRPMAPQYRAATAQSQNAFLLSDKTGNSLFSQTVTFQPADDGMAWNTGTTTGDIGGLKFIARTNVQMATGSSDDILQMLEELSGTDQADAEAIASTIEMNENVEEAYSADGSNVIVKMEGDDNYVAYPMYSIGAVFSEEGDVEVLQEMSNARKKVDALRLTGQKERVAIFNFFEGGFGEPNDQKSAFSYFIQSMFEDSPYEVEYYGHGFDNNGVPTFTTERLDDVISHSSDYAAIIIMSHGYETKEGDTYFATCERCQKGKEYHYVISIDGSYFVPYSSNMYLNSNCLLYLGPCFGVPQKGYRFPMNTVIGWQGINSVSQIHAAVFFHKLLYNSNEQVSVKRAWQSTFQTDPFHPSTQLYKSDNLFQWDGVSNPKMQQDYANGITAAVKVGDYELGKDKFIKYTGKQQEATISGFVYGNVDDYSSIVKLRLEPILRIQKNGEYYYSGPDNKGAFLSSDLGGGVKSFSAEFTLNDHILEGIYRVNVYIHEQTSTSWELVVQPNPVYVIYSSKLPDNYALPEVSDEDCYMPSVLGTDGKPVEEITIPAGTSRTYQLDAFPGHTFDTPCLDVDGKVATVSLSGATLTVTGVSEGSTYFGVFDRQNHKMAVVNVTVTPGGTPQSYLTCPDDHHPHLIDLGLPSGTKWACCNVDDDSSKQSPTNYGSYYAWGETKEHEDLIYDWSTYTHCDGSSSTCHDLGSDIAGTEFDVAHMKWGGSWVMPSREQQDELRYRCTFSWTTVNGVNGGQFTGPNGNSIFIPAAGYFRHDSLLDVGSLGNCWSSTFYDNRLAWELYFYPDDSDRYANTRNYGFSVRPVSR